MHVGAPRSRPRANRSHDEDVCALDKCPIDALNASARHDARSDVLMCEHMGGALFSTAAIVNAPLHLRPRAPSPPTNSFCHESQNRGHSKSASGHSCDSHFTASPPSSACTSATTDSLDPTAVLFAEDRDAIDADHECQYIYSNATATNIWMNFFITEL